jgi:phage gpG-like protein
MDVRQFALVMRTLRAEIEAAAIIGLHEAAEIVKDEAKRWIGEEHDIWPPLAESTINEKERLGFEVPKPLLRTGELRDSIRAAVVGMHAEIGTDHRLGPIHEHGTNHVPPRPFLGPALLTKTPEAIAAIEANIAKAIKKIA